jgi:hypothetical protein
VARSSNAAVDAKMIRVRSFFMVGLDLRMAAGGRWQDSGNRSDSIPIPRDVGGI